MNYKRVNVEICKAIVDRDDVRAQELEEGMTLVIPYPHYYGYIMTKEEIAFAIDKITKLPPESHIAKLEVISPENEIKMTDDFRLIPYKRGMSRRFNKDGKTVWVNNEYLKNLDVYACQFYQAKDKDLDGIIVTEGGAPVMVVLPLVRHD